LATLELEYNKSANSAELEIVLVHNSKRIHLNKLHKICNCFYADKDELYFCDALSNAKILSIIPNGFMLITQNGVKQFEKEILPAVSEKIPTIRKDQLGNAIDMEPKAILRISELDQKLLLFKLSFRYMAAEADWQDKDPFILSFSGKEEPTLIKRNLEKEEELFRMFIQKNENFSTQINAEHFHISISLAMQDFWFIRFVTVLNDAGFEIHGRENLKLMRFSDEPFKFKIVSGSQNDWFDLQTEVSFGDEQIGLDRVMNAINNKSSYVMLANGSYGVIPELWIKKYALLMKMSVGNKNNHLRLHPSHLMLLADAEEEIEDNNFILAIREKQNNLLQLEQKKWDTPSKKIKASLRPYQLHGFQWLQQMHFAGMGACLADDMGLGKTLQTITFIDYLLNKEKEGRVLVVCPTSLLFNWESEIKKFAPHIKFSIHHGSDRDKQFESSKARLILTSYGTLRNDLQHMLELHWLYIVLDESQAIKNPEAQMTKALGRIPSKNKLILSGTPIQNNTFDLWSQFNFINPGLLGNKNFFKDNFSTPIDKERDAIVTGQLKKLTSPFILRRTKDQVAQDLPPKTESILWCEMASDQRKIYDEVKEYYRLSISQTLEQEGLEKSQFKILEGLLRLRQICDSPALMKKAEYNSASSAKLDELLRELKENTGDHKVLVFSQFTEMLALIKKQLTENNISYCYLDGSTSVKERQQQTTSFQNNSTIRVFLISLKAGGVGLNLTSADYVYLVDPWWNPAAEQQAIDRTHRIGQTSPVIAYKMICKDSIEEKILTLQSHKKGIASDLIQEDAAIFKKLKKDDILGLFS
jgi:superfamily II DNA or RNA helicase